MFPYLYRKVNPSPEKPSKRLYGPLVKGHQSSHLLARFTLRIQQSLRLEDILQTSVKEVQKILNTDRVLVYRFNADRSGYVAAEAVSSPWPPLINKTVHDPCLETDWDIPFQAGYAIAIDNIYTSGVTSCYLEMLEHFQVKANLVVPVLEKDKLWGLLMAHHCQSPRTWNITDVRLVQQLSVQMGVALQQAELYQALQQNNIALEQSNRRLRAALLKEHELSGLKSKFLSVTSHEFRTPLTTIRSSTELLESFPCSEEEQQKLYRQIYQSVDYMVELLDDVRFMSHGETEFPGLTLSPINLIQFCQSILQEITLSIAPEHHFRFKPNNLPKILYLDTKLLRQILYNLLSNAVKYALKNREIELLAAHSQDQLLIQVKDQGIGIPLEDHSFLFETFYRGKNVGTIRGTGLGLSIVKRCVDIHGGALSFESEEGVGTTFSITLPASEQLSTK
jgi:signal transduction histidine kinase